MSEILACRICLTSNIRLFNIYEHNLVNYYEFITTSLIKESDKLPHYVCSFCRCLIVKCVRFMKACQESQQLLKNVLQKESFVYNDHFNIGLNHCIHPYKTVLIQDDSELKYEVKSENEEFAAKNLELPSVIDKIKSEIVSDGDISPLIDSESFMNSVINDRCDKSDRYDSDTSDDDIEIVVVPEKEQLEKIELRKSSANYLNSIYKCNFCYKGFVTNATFKKHMLRHDKSSGDHECPICHVRCPTTKALRAHRFHIHERKYVCKKCKHVSQCRNRANEHSKWHKGVTYNCELCDKQFSKRTTLLTHVRLQHPSEHACDVCGKTFIGKYGLKMHKKIAHKKGLEKVGSGTFACTRCSVDFQNVEARKTHKCGEDLKWCSMCGAGLKSVLELKRHKKSHHPRPEYKCVKCNKCTVSEMALSVHYQSAHGEVRTQVKRAKTELKSVVCEMCGKKCMSYANLVDHQRTHTGEKPFECSECPKRFRVQQSLQIHERVHTGERPYSCTRCPKAFGHKAALNRHERVHSGAKPYACPHCGKCFSQSNSMKMHVKTVHLKMPTPYKNKSSK